MTLEGSDGSVSDNHNSTHDDSDDPGLSDPESVDGDRRGLCVTTLGNRPKVMWGPEEYVHDWSQAELKFRHYSVVGYDHWNLVGLGGHTTLQDDRYRQECGFVNRLNYP